jgi:DNA-binding ferritin-like protein
MFALYVKTKNFHWHISWPHFRDYHLMLDEQSEQIFATTDDIAERARKIGGTTIRSIGHIARLQRVADNDADYVTPQDMLAELRDDNKELPCACARPTTCATSTATWRRRACSRTGSTRQSGAPGSCSRAPATDVLRVRAQKPAPSS